MTIFSFLRYSCRISCYIMIHAVLLFFISCKNEVPKKVTDEGLKPKEFLTIVPEWSQPIFLEEKDLTTPVRDSQQIHLTTFKSYLSDSLYRETTCKNEKAAIAVLGKITASDKSVYLFVKAIAGKHKNISVLYFDDQQVCRGRLSLLDSKDIKSGIHYSVKVDARYNFYLINKKILADGSEWSGENIYYFDLSGLPIMAVTNTNEDLSNQILGNPIDSFPAKHKYSADYSTDKQNLVSIRDGRTDKTLQFFIHFSKRQGKCIGELKGEADWVNKSLAVYRDSKSPCVIEFRFAPKSVNIRETTGCGSYRDIKCIFEGTYPKVKKMHYNNVRSSHK